MPNYCANSVTIEGPNLDKVLPDPFSLQKIKPMPAELMTEDEEAVGTDMIIGRTKTYSRAWYPWRLMNWGTKWDLDNDEGRELGMEEGCDLCVFGFSTAWSPPTEAFIHLVKDHPELKVTLSYFEPGCEIAGYAVITKDGVQEYASDIDSHRTDEQYEAFRREHPAMDWIVDEYKEMRDCNDEDEEPDEEEKELRNKPIELEMTVDWPLDKYLMKCIEREVHSSVRVNRMLRKMAKDPTSIAAHLPAEEQKKEETDVEVALRLMGYKLEEVEDPMMVRVVPV
jgi:hypothetical protein